MATYKTTISSAVSSARWTDTAAGSTAVGASSSSIDIHQIRMDNTANLTKLFLKIYNVAVGEVTVGTTPPSVVLPVEAGSSVQYDVDPGIALATALSYAVVTTAGTAGSTDPGTAITVVFLTS